MESSVLYVLDVGEVRIDVGGLVGVGVFFWTVGILLVLESVGLVGALAVDVPKSAKLPRSLAVNNSNWI